MQKLPISERLTPHPPLLSPDTIHLIIALGVHAFNVKEKQLAHISPIAILHIKYSYVNNLILVVKYSTGSAHFIRGLDPFYSVGNYVRCSTWSIYSRYTDIKRSTAVEDLTN